MSEPKYAHRFPPCPAYDVEGLESWLEDLAKQGLLLTKGGLFCGFLEFEKTAPRAMRYRLQPLPKPKFLEDRGPHTEAVELAEAYGWEYLCIIGDFAVYGTADPDVRELDTDPQVQAVALKQLYKRKRNGILITAAWVVFALAIVVYYGPVSFFLSRNLWYNWTSAAILALFPFVAFRELKQLKELKQKLALGEPLARTGSWKQTRIRHWVSAVLSIALIVTFYGSWLVNDFVDWEDDRWQPLAEYTGTLPFLTMEDLAGVGTFRPDSFYVKQDDHIAERSTLLAKRQIILQQFGDVTDGGMVLLDGNLQVEYYELRTSWLARALYQEMLRSDAKSKYYHILDVTSLPTEQEAAYRDVFPTLLLQDGSKVLKVTFTQFDEENAMPLDQWTTAMAEAFVK